MIYTKITELAMKIAYKAHNGQVDKAEIPYIFHPIHVAEQMQDEESTVVALLHDVIEDTAIKEEDLLNYGFSNKIVASIKILSKPKDMNYFEYIDIVNTNEISVKVKIADLNHNSDLSRISNPTEKDIKRIEKYKKAKSFLISKE